MEQTSLVQEDLIKANDSLDYKLEMECHENGVEKGSRLVDLIDKASQLGGEHIHAYNQYSQDMFEVMRQVCLNIDESDIQLQTNEKTGDVRYVVHADMRGKKYSLEITSNKEVLEPEKTNSPIEIPHVLTSVRLKEGGATVQNVAYYTKIVSGSLDLLAGINTAICMAAVKQARKTALVAVRGRAFKIMNVSKETLVKATEEEVATLVKKSTSKFVRVSARVGVPVNVALTAIFIASFVIDIISHNTFWQLTLINKTNMKLDWDNDTKHGDLRNAPIDEDNNVITYLDAEKVTKDGDWSETIEYSKVVLTFAHEGALSGVDGKMLLKLTDENTGRELVYTLDYDFPWKGSNSVDVTGEEQSGLPTTATTYELIDKVNNIIINYSLSAKKGEHRVPTINDNALDYNFTTQLTLKNWKQTNG
ncbi:hypothetical protein D0814_23700 [Vibrio parahaemolyticus]|nr:hypothetical protein [Vibrio parahaemolyticus]EHH1260219.1 hypothetical protein [Vibrio parahaemolyticus]